MAMTRLVHGKVRGKSIEIEEDLGLADGQNVEISVRPVPPVDESHPGAGLARTEGALADDPHWDAIMDEIHRSRKRERRAKAESR